MKIAVIGAGIIGVIRAIGEAGAAAASLGALLMGAMLIVDLRLLGLKRQVPIKAALKPVRYKVRRSVINTTEIKMMESCNSKPAKKAAQPGCSPNL